MKMLLLIIPLLFGCAREYTCSPQWRNTETGEISSTCEMEQSCINYTVDWPKSKKEANNQCDAAFEGQVSYNELGEYTGTFLGCTCEKAN